MEMWLASAIDRLERSHRQAPIPLGLSFGGSLTAGCFGDHCSLPAPPHAIMRRQLEAAKLLQILMNLRAKWPLRRLDRFCVALMALLHPLGLARAIPSWRR